MPTDRETPVGRKLNDGFGIKIAFEADPDISIWEKNVKLPGFDGGDPINTSTNWNEVLETFAPQILKTMTEGGMRVQFDPAIYNQIPDILNVNTLVTIHIPNRGSIDFWGYLRTWEPDEAVKGQPVEASCAIQPTNENDEGEETLPVYNPPTGT